MTGTAATKGWTVRKAELILARRVRSFFFVCTSLRLSRLRACACCAFGIGETLGPGAGAWVLRRTPERDDPPLPGGHPPGCSDGVAVVVLAARTRAQPARPDC